MIRDIDPNTPAYARDYVNGWNASERGSDGALDRADGRNVSHAWYDGYQDSAVGRPKWTYRTWRRNGCSSDCGYLCAGPHDEAILYATWAEHSTQVDDDERAVAHAAIMARWVEVIAMEGK